MNENKSLACVCAGAVYVLAGAAGIALTIALISDGPFTLLHGLPAVVLGAGLLGSGIVTFRRAWPPRPGPAPWAPLGVGCGLLLMLIASLVWLAIGLVAGGVMLSRGS